MEQAHAEEVKRIKSKYRSEIAGLEKRLLEQDPTLLNARSQV